MGTTKNQLRQWFDEGVEQNAAYMIIVCDTFDYEDFPVYVAQDENVRERHSVETAKPMQKVMEVYNLGLDREQQMTERRAFNF